MVLKVMDDLQQFGIDSEDSQSFAAVYLVGGSVAFPPVSRRLRELFGRKVRISPYPQAATAIGLAVSADPQARISIREAVTRHFGIWREGEEGREKVFDPIFRKDSLMEAGAGRQEVVREYRPVHNVGHLRYLECSALGEAGEPQGDLFVWEEVSISLMTPNWSGNRTWPASPWKNDRTWPARKSARSTPTTNGGSSRFNSRIAPPATAEISPSTASPENSHCY